MSDLDPRGLEAALHAVEGEGLTSDGGTPHGWRCEHPDRYPDYCKCPIDVAESAVTAYLEVAQPVVETVEELVELPGRSAVVDADGMVAQMDAHDPHHWDGLERCWDATQITLPARVIWRPHD